MKLRASLNHIYSQKNSLKTRSKFSVNDLEEYEKLKAFLNSNFPENDVSKESIVTTDSDMKSKKSNSKTLSIKSERITKMILGWISSNRQQKFLAEMSLVYLISFQEAFFKEYITEILISQRNILKSTKSITYEEICGFSSIDSLILYMAQEDMDKTLRGGIDEIAEYLEKRFDLTLKSEFADWQIVREASFRRNIIIHNTGITNKIYCSKTGYNKTNEHLTTDLDYVLSATNAIISFIDFMHSRMCEKLGLPPPKLITSSAIVKKKHHRNA